MDLLDKMCRSKTEKQNTAIEFCILELVYNPGQNIWNKMEQSSKTGQEKKAWYLFLRVF